MFENVLARLDWATENTELKEQLKCARAGIRIAHTCVDAVKEQLRITKTQLGANETNLLAVRGAFRLVSGELDIRTRELEETQEQLRNVRSRN